jgi:predicted transglutaminase-like cysteine proteinase
LNDRQKTTSILLIALTAALSFLFAQGTAQAGQAPLGYQLMCLKTPAACRAGGSSKMRVDEGTMATLKRVNMRVNSNIRPKNDARGTDVWTVNASSGDCEDYAITKRAALIREGLPPSALRIAYVKTRNGIGHAVLVVKTSQGVDLVLDNLTQAIRPLSQSGLRLISMSSADPLKWT